MQADLACMSDVFREFPAITGVPVPIKPVERSRKTKEALSAKGLLKKDPFIKYGGYLRDGGDLHVGTMSVKEAKTTCQKLAGCRGFTFNGPDDGGEHNIHFKDFWEVHEIGDMVWTSYKYEAPWTEHDGYLAQGDDLLVGQCTIEGAKVVALEMPGCQGFTFHGAVGEGLFTIHWKSWWSLCKTDSMTWTSFKYTGPPIVAPAPAQEQA